MSAESRVAAQHLLIPPPPTPAGHYVLTRTVGDLMFVSGQTPTTNGQLAFTGRLGAEISISDGQEAARLAALNLLAVLRDALGSLDQVEDVVKLTGYVACTPDFDAHPAVINGASQLLEDVFLEHGRHARAALGVAALPGGAPVEVELIVSVRREF